MKKNKKDKSMSVKYIRVVKVLILLIIGMIPIYKSLMPSIETIKDSTVMIEVFDENSKLVKTGSGFSAYESNYIVTNYHVIEGGYYFNIVTQERKRYTVKNVLIFNKENDIAILDAIIDLTPLKLGSSKTIKTGQKVTTIGSPLGELNTVSTGIISNAKNSKGIQITAPISSGSSGGVLLDKYNRVIGITYATLSNGNNLNYAISINYLNELFKDYKEHNYYDIRYGYIDECLSSAVELSETNELKFYSCGYDETNNFVPDTLLNFYKVTNDKYRFENLINSTDWNSFYHSLSNSDKDKTIAIINNIAENNYCYLDKCDIENIKNWSTTEFFMNLNILNNYELALVMTDLDNFYTNNDKFNRVNNYPLSAAQKTLILYLIGSRNWNDISPTNKRDIFDLIDSLSLNADQKGTILSFLGYRVVFNDSNHFTAYW